MTRQEAIAAIRAAGSQIVGIEFIKRSTGELRTGAFRGGVVRVKGEAGSGPAYTPAEHDLLLLWDMAKGYRAIPFEGLRAITVAGTRHEVS